MNTFQLKVYAHDTIYFNGEAQSVLIPALDGGYQLMARHEECVVAVCEGELLITDAEGKKLSAVCGRGFAEFHTGENYAEVLVDTVERPEEIDVRRAREAKERAEECLRQKQSLMEHNRSAAALARAMARLKEASKYNHS